MENKKLEDSLLSTITDPTIDITSDAMEIIIDNVLADGILKDIPVVNTIKSVIKAGFSIRERAFLSKLFQFMNSSSIDRNSMQFKKFFAKVDKKNQKNELSRYLLELIDKTTEYQKIPLYSKIFDFIINNELDWKNFYYLSISLDKLHPIGIGFLNELMENSNKDGKSINVPRDEREGFLTSAGLTSRYGKQVHINEYGKKLYYSIS